MVKSWLLNTTVKGKLELDAISLTTFIQDTIRWEMRWNKRKAELKVWLDWKWWNSKQKREFVRMLWIRKPIKWSWLKPPFHSLCQLHIPALQRTVISRLTTLWYIWFQLQNLLISTNYDWTSEIFLKWLQKCCWAIINRKMSLTSYKYKKNK